MDSEAEDLATLVPLIIIGKKFKSYACYFLRGDVSGPAVVCQTEVVSKTKKDCHPTILLQTITDSSNKLGSNFPRENDFLKSISRRPLNVPFCNILILCYFCYILRFYNSI